MEREIMILNRWEQGRSSIDKLLSQERLERIEPNRDHAYALIEQARRATSSASVLSATEDTIAAFNAAYDAARKALTAILVNEGLRPGGGEGGHAVLREAVLAQLEPPTQLSIRAFGWMRQVRNSSSYPEPNAPVADRADVTEAIRAALEVIKVAEKVVPGMPVDGR